MHGVTVTLVIGATMYLASPEMQQMTADMREAMRICGWDTKQVGRVIGASRQRVSDQLLNKEDFTLLRRFRLIPAVWRQFNLIQVQRHGDNIVVLPEGYAATVYRLADVTMAMAKMQLQADAPKEKTA